jgi:hypothetical protein
MNPIREALEQSGLSAFKLDRIRLARGVVGKATYVAVAAILALGGIAWRVADSLQLLLAGGLIVLIFVLYFIGVLWFANRHPGVALLEGAELIQWRQMDIAGKSVRAIDNVPVLPGPEARSDEAK